MASIHKNNGGINLEGMIKYANPLSTGSYGDLQASNISEDISSSYDTEPYMPTQEEIDKKERINSFLYGSEDIDMGMAPDLALSPLMSGKSLLSLANKAKNVIKSGKNVVKGFPQAKRVDAGNWSKKHKKMIKHDIVNVEMVDETGKVFKQPFYKSSGTSGGIGDASLRKGTWEPFLGRGGGGYKPHQYAKGFFTKSDDMQYINEGHVRDLIAKGMNKNQADFAARLGPFNKVSDEIARLDKLGYYNKNLYHNIKGPEQVNKFLTEQGVKLPFSAGK